MNRVDYVFVGHISKDLAPEGPRLGGTVTFGALTAQALGLQTGIVTSAPDDVVPLMAPLQSIPTVRVPSQQPTTFVNTYTSSGRQQIISGRAADLHLEHIPENWRKPRILHLAPVAAEVDPALSVQLQAEMVVMTPQGWLRRWDDQGRVVFAPWPDAPQVLSRVQAVVLSIEDVAGDTALIREYAQVVPVLVMTRGPQGCTLFVNGRPEDFPAPEMQEVDPTGAGDIFAVSFFTHYYATRDPRQAVRFATFLASQSVTRLSLKGIPTPVDIQTARRLYNEDTMSSS